eukprot:14437061-Ditylum_brightwellii.AAC.1
MNICTMTHAYGINKREKYFLKPTLDGILKFCNDEEKDMLNLRVAAPDSSSTEYSTFQASLTKMVLTFHNKAFRNYATSVEDVIRVKKGKNI